jgi:hypothetical protein
MERFSCAGKRRGAWRGEWGAEAQRWQRGWGEEAQGSWGAGSSGEVSEAKRRGGEKAPERAFGDSPGRMG